MRRFYLAGPLLLSSLVALAVGTAQSDAAPKQRPTPAAEAEPKDLGLAEVRGLLRLGKTEEALAKLRAMNEANPGDPKVTLLLGRQLAEMDKPDEAVALYRKTIDVRATERPAGDSKAGDPRAADPTWAKANGVTGGAASELAPIFIDLQRLHRELGDWDQALAVCLEYQTRFGGRDGARAAGWVSEEVESLIRSDRLGPKAVETIGRAVEQSPKDEGLARLYIQALYHTDRSVEALEAARGLDARLGAHGAVLMQQAMMAIEENAFEHAIAAIDLALAADPKASLKADALHQKARSLRKLRRLDESLLAYDALLAESRTSRLGRAAGLEKAQILAQELNRKEDALVAYRELLSALGSKPKGDDREVAGEVQLAMAECALALGRPEEAGAIYAALADSAAGSPGRARALFESAEMLFFQGKMKEAETTYYQLTDDYPSDAFVNDALERILVIGENGDQGGAPLAALSQAVYQRRLGRADRALQLVSDAISAHPGSRAQDDLRFLQVRLLLDLQQEEPAQMAADALATGFRDSPLASRGLVEVAQRLAERPEGRRMAEKLYERVLLQFPECIEGSAVRAALRDLKSKLRESSDALAPGSPGCNTSSSDLPMNAETV